MKKLMVLFFAWVTVFSVAATEEQFKFTDMQQQQLFRELTHELRCPKCQNQNIADSNALVAQDLKRKVYQLVSQGKNKTQVVDYMKQRYGEFVYYQPALTPATFILWALPAFIVVLGLIVLFRKRASQDIDPDKLAQAKKLLEDE
ncbi:cytochrome c-type biogenesis protein [Neptunicella marina]|uniref:Cytochrome c-type biogenesis protein n=1 Tax=Neptunicella marina TaxID=2125989 RepID=A0A8J6LW13_9ALTE|nr:cytochrome c-type biogenesis protein [Neptunicella marina]MBC3764964.1 cytochrome c-type biogenesis protein CcmH [Neptunicella marina]